MECVVITGFSGAVCYKRHHGAPHRLLSHQWGRDTLLLGQDIDQDYPRKTRKKEKIILIVQYQTEENKEIDVYRCSRP